MQLTNPRLLLLSIAAVSFGAAGCSESAEFQGNAGATEGIASEAVVVDYNAMPLAQIQASLGDCAVWRSTAADQFWLPTLGQAQANGYGYIARQIELLGSTTSEATIDCSAEQDRIVALDTATHLAAQGEATSDATERWSACMEEGGFSDIADPGERQDYLAKKLYGDVETEEVSQTIARAHELKATEVLMATVDVSCQYQTIATVADLIATEQQTVIDEAPEDQAQLLTGQ